MYPTAIEMLASEHRTDLLGAAEDRRRVTGPETSRRSVLPGLLGTGARLTARVRRLSATWWTPAAEPCCA